ncbi:MAG: hypothetical protein OXC62_16255, partial [Aestuariivita sp.]|nr:hypothetical protein [Aestuariivita sp.]
RPWCSITGTSHCIAATEIHFTTRRHSAPQPVARMMIIGQKLTVGVLNSYEKFIALLKNL